jgi:hypothetical protein
MMPRVGLGEPVNIGFATAVMVHVADVEAALAWYRRAFPQAALCCTDEEAFEYLCLGGVNLEFVAADGKVSSGPCGSVVSWRVSDFEAMLYHLQSIGGRLYRGPSPRSLGQWHRHSRAEQANESIQLKARPNPSIERTASVKPAAAAHSNVRRR